MKLFRQKLWRGLAIATIVLSVFIITLTGIANAYAPMVNNFLNIEGSETTGGNSEEAQYYTSDYEDLNDMFQAKVELMREIAREGTVLLKNEDGVLPVKSGKVTILGESDFVFATNSGGGSMGNLRSGATTRSAWDTTYPQTLELTATADMISSLSDTRKYENGIWNDTKSRIEAEDVRYVNITTAAGLNGLETTFNAVAMRGKDYDDEGWTEILDNLSIYEMSNMVAQGRYYIQAVPSATFPESTGSDSPIGLNIPYQYYSISPVTGETVSVAGKNPTQDYTYWAGKAQTKGNLLKEDASDKDIAYQFSSTYVQEGAGTYYVLINMFADGYVRVYQYRGMLFEYAGYWTNDGEDLGLWVGVLEYGMDNNGLSVYTYNYSNSLLYGEDATFTFTYSISLAGADGGIYVRAVEFNNQTGEVQYETAGDWVNYVKNVTGESFELLDFSSWTGNDVKETLAEVTMSADDGSGTTRNVLFYAENEYDFGGLSGTWSIDGTTLALDQKTDNGAEWIVTANSDGTYTLTYDYHNDEGTVFVGTLSAEDFRILAASQIAASVTLRFGGNADGYAIPMEIYTDGTFSIQGGSITGTWSVENGVLAFSEESITYDAATATITLNNQSTFSAVLTAEQQEALGLIVQAS